jgi:hypothetical protein
MVIMQLHFIELTSQIDAPEGYANEPDFDKQLWPLLVNNAEEIDQVLLFAHPFSQLDQKSIQRYERAGKLFANVGPMRELSASELETLENRSFAGGHLSVLYRLNRERWILPVWSQPTQMNSPGWLRKRATHTCSYRSRTTEIRFISSVLGERWSRYLQFDLQRLKEASFKE